MRFHHRWEQQPEGSRFRRLRERRWNRLLLWRYAILLALVLLIFKLLKVM